jgi:ABC-type transporter Mla maintaining outer membrane lipid asymmetry ATPase subunit MlaF
MTLVVVTHDPSEALTLCDRAVVLADGRVGIDGPWSTVLVDTQTDPLLQAFKTSAAMRAS